MIRMTMTTMMAVGATTFDQEDDERKKQRDFEASRHSSLIRFVLLAHRNDLLNSRTV